MRNGVKYVLQYVVLIIYAERRDLCHECIYCVFDVDCAPLCGSVFLPRVLRTNNVDWLAHVYLHGHFTQWSRQCVCNKPTRGQAKR